MTLAEKAYTEFKKYTLEEQAKYLTTLIKLKQKLELKTNDERITQRINDINEFFTLVNQGG